MAGGVLMRGDAFAMIVTHGEDELKSSQAGLQWYLCTTSGAHVVYGIHERGTDTLWCLVSTCCQVLASYRSSI